MSDTTKVHENLLLEVRYNATSVTYLKRGDGTTTVHGYGERADVAQYLADVVGLDMEKILSAVRSGILVDDRDGDTVVGVYELKEDLAGFNHLAYCTFGWWFVDTWLIETLRGFKVTVQPVFNIGSYRSKTREEWLAAYVDRPKPLTWSVVHERADDFPGECASSQPFAMPKYRLKAADVQERETELTVDEHRAETRRLLLRKLRAETLIEELKAYELIDGIGETYVFDALSTVRQWTNRPAEGRGHECSYTVDQLCSPPFLKELVPDAEAWDRCETFGDRCDLMERTITRALGPII